MKHIFSIFVMTIFCLIILLPQKVKSKSSKKTNKPLIVQDAKIIENDQIAVWVTNNGTFARRPVKGNAGFFYPQNEQKTVLYVAGLWIAGKVNGEIRTACADYNAEYQPGIILPGGIADDPAKEEYRIYQIKPGDSADPNDPNYNRDYAEWPVENGALIDENGKPLILGEQTLWYVMNDGNQELHDSAYHTQPLNIEVQVLNWVFNNQNSHLGKTLFMYYKIINKSPNTINDAYIGIWCDPDLGDCNDDRSGCDTTLNLSYTYNGRDFDWQYGSEIPAVGILLLQPPIVPSPGDSAFQFLCSTIYNFRPLKMSANQVYIGGHALYRDPAYSIQGSNQLFNQMQGLAFDGSPLIDPSTGLPSAFMDYGDPIERTGWLDDYILPYCDRRSMLSSGPFFMAQGDTQRVAFAVVIGQDETRLTSILDLKQSANYIRDTFRSEFKVKAEAEITVDCFSPDYVELIVNSNIETNNSIVSVWAELYNYKNSLFHRIELFDDGLHEDGSAHDYIFGNSWLSKPTDDALFLNLIIKDNSGKEYLFSRASEKITLIDNKIRISSIKIVEDHINYDGKINPGENIRFTFNIENCYYYDFGVANLFINSDDPYIQIEKKHFFFYNLKSGNSDSLIYDSENEATFFEMTINRDTPDSHSIYLGVKLFDDQHHSWYQKKFIKLQVEPFDYFPEEIIPSHVSGNGNAKFVVRIIEPENLKKHEYLITVVDSINQYDEKGFNLIDQTMGDTLLHNHKVPDKYANNIPITDGFKIAKAYLSLGGFNGRCIEVEQGHPTAFQLVNEDGSFINTLYHRSIMTWVRGDAFPQTVELEFTNDINIDGVQGIISGQNAYRYTLLSGGAATGFFTCPFNIWKVENGERVSRLNIWFRENIYGLNYDEVWTPGEYLYILNTNYDSTGQFNILNWDDILFEFYMSFENKESVVDSGDKIIINYETSATSQDIFMFVPTEIEQEIKRETPGSFVLYQNYPNPFNPTTTIKFSINKPCQVSLKIYNIMGQEIVELIDENLMPGFHSVQWHGKNKDGQLVSSGLYFAKLTSNKKTKLIKMLLIR